LTKRAVADRWVARSGREEMAEEVEDFEEDFGLRMIGKRLADDTKNQYEQKGKSEEFESMPIASNSDKRRTNGMTMMKQSIDCIDESSV
jgi:hypothetical protein